MKNNSISLIRAIATCMIVSCHILQGLGNELAFWMNIGVQIFLCMSGYLYGKKEIKGVTAWYKRQYFKIMLPMWILATVVILVMNLMKERIAISSILFTYLGIAEFRTIPILTHTWFITYILLCYLITPLLQMIDIEKTEKKWHFCFEIAGIILVMAFLQLGNLIQIMPQYIACYIVGYFFARRETKTGGKREIKELTIFLTVIAALTLPIRLYIQYGSGSITWSGWSAVQTQITQWHHSLLGIVLFFGMLFLFEKIHIKENRVIRYFDKSSYSIYLVHQIFILNTFSLLEVTDFLFVNIIVIIAVVCVSAFLLDKATALVKRILPVH